LRFAINYYWLTSAIGIILLNYTQSRQVFIDISAPLGSRIFVLDQLIHGDGILCLAHALIQIARTEQIFRRVIRPSQIGAGFLVLLSRLFLVIQLGIGITQQAIIPLLHLLVAGGKVLQVFDGIVIIAQFQVAAAGIKRGQVGSFGTAVTGNDLQETCVDIVSVQRQPGRIQAIIFSALNMASVAFFSLGSLTRL
jgi:hypothetical protein